MKKVPGYTFLCAMKQIHGITSKQYIVGRQGKKYNPGDCETIWSELTILKKKKLKYQAYA